MSGGPVRRAGVWTASVAALCLAGACGVPAAASGAPGPGPADSIPAALGVFLEADASALYNAGTVALERGEVGPAVALLVAAGRLEPRASDIRANLKSAEAASLRARGGDVTDQGALQVPALLSANESWWLAATLLACGALAGLAGLVRKIPARARYAAPTLVGVGLLLSVWLHIQAWEEASHPEAVVIVPALSVERGPGEPSRAAVLLGAGERVRLGTSRGRLAEIRIGGNSVGWADREGLWKVVETPRYTSQYAKR